ncbi:MAG: acd [Caulobacteraceae bacterium]|nr:acd [Caulobacteraceae bacterium]
MSYQPPVREHLFLLNEVLGLEQYGELEGFANAPAELIEPVLQEAARFAAEVLAPLNAVGDKSGCRLGPDASVTTPPGFKEAYAKLVEAGWPGLATDPQWGGQGFPAVVDLAFGEFSSSANMAFAMYPGLTHGAYKALTAAGSDALKALYLPRLATGRWAGTMNLTEPQCGTDLALIRTKATRADDGAYRITGQKIWISGGEQDLTENIVHLVLARLDDAPPGVKGISLFLVPKFIPDADGSLGARNAATCAGLEEKMGIHGNATCVMAYDGATGWLIGEENAGLKMMFVMMNEARLGVALQGLAQAEAAYQAAASFAKERLQGRSLSGPKNPEGPADPILVHADVRRLLMDSRAIVEGGRALLAWTNLQGDLAQAATDEAARIRAADLQGLLTPVCKAYLTDQGFQIASNAMQVHGGSGFTEHFPVSQSLRDSRIAMIYEGTNGVQAMDLVGRKLPAHGGRAAMAWFAELDAEIAKGGDETLKPFLDGLASAKAQLQEATLWLMQHGLANPEDAAAASHDYLHLFGLTGLALGWAMMARAAQPKIAAGDADPFYAAKLITGRYFLERVLPQACSHLAKLKTGAAPLMALPAEMF